MRRIEFYFDFISPYSYLAAMQLPALAERNRIDIEWTPVNLPKLIKQSGNKPPGQIKNKAIYSLRDLKRWAAYLDLPFKMIRPGTFDSRPALRIAAALEGEARISFSLGVYEGLWTGQIDPTQPDWLDELFTLKGFPSQWRDMYHDVLDENTQRALAAGAFGVPTFLLHGTGRPEMYFGVDHLGFLERSLQQ